jgi:hypothetical protein
LLPGTYVGGIEVDVVTTMPLRIVGTGATLDGPQFGLRVIGGSNVFIRGTSITGTDQVVTCGDAQSPQSALRIEESLLFAADRALMTSVNCRVTMFSAELRGGAGQNGALAPGSDTIFEGDRLKIHSSGLGTLAIQPLGSRISMRVTNSILEDVYVAFTTFDSAQPGSRFDFGYNTFVMRRADNGILCQSNSGSAHRTTRFADNILLAPGVTNAVENAASDCYLQNNVIYPEPAGAIGNIVMDPQLVDFAAGDFRPRPTSPAIGRGGIAIPTDHDFLGTSRPQGSGPDIGAFEQ